MTMRTVLEIATTPMTQSRRNAFVAALERRGLVTLGGGSRNGQIISYVAGGGRAVEELSDAITAGKPLALVEHIITFRRAAPEITVTVDDDATTVTFEAVFHPDPDGDGRTPLDDTAKTVIAQTVADTGGRIRNWASVGGLTYAVGVATRPTLAVLAQQPALRALRHVPSVTLRDT